MPNSGQFALGHNFPSAFKLRWTEFTPVINMLVDNSTTLGLRCPCCLSIDTMNCSCWILETDRPPSNNKHGVASTGAKSLFARCLWAWWVISISCGWHRRLRGYLWRPGRTIKIALVGKQSSYFIMRQKKGGAEAPPFYPSPVHSSG